MPAPSEMGPLAVRLSTSFERKDSAAKAEQDFDFYYKYSLLSQRDKEIVMDMIESMLSRSKNED